MFSGFERSRRRRSFGRADPRPTHRAQPLSPQRVDVDQEGARAFDLTLEGTPAPPGDEATTARPAQHPSRQERDQTDEKAARRCHRRPSQRARGEPLERALRRVDQLSPCGLRRARRDGQMALLAGCVTLLAVPPLAHRPELYSSYRRNRSYIRRRLTIRAPIASIPRFMAVLLSRIQPISPPDWGLRPAIRKFST